MIWLNNLIAHLLPLIPKSVVEIFARQYLAGETLDQVVKKVQELNRQNMSTTLDYLGEDPKEKFECLAAVDVYKQAVDQIHIKKLNSGISLKLSHMGLKIDKQFCFENMAGLVAYAKEKNVFVRIDIEDFSLKKDTIDIYFKLKKTYDNVGMAMQAYLRSAIDDANWLVEKKANVRLCKGAYYWEDEKNVYKDNGVVNSSYVYLLEKLLANKCFAAIATHDDALVFEAIRIIDKLKISKHEYEFQMLYGVQEHLRDILMAQDHPVRIYIPFGEQWLAYCTRRLKENPKIVSYVFAQALKNIGFH